MVSDSHGIRQVFASLVAIALGLFVLLQSWSAIEARGPGARVRELMPAVGAVAIDRPMSLEMATFPLELPPTAGQPARRMTLGDFPPDTILFVNFWATWCEPCVREIPSMLSLKRELGSSRFQMIAISYDESWEDLLTFFRRFTGGLPRELRLARDPATEEAETLRMVFGTRKLPETWIVRNGQVLARFVNERNWVDEAIVEYFQRLLETPP